VNPFNASWRYHDECFRRLWGKYLSFIVHPINTAKTAAIVPMIMNPLTISGHPFRELCSSGLYKKEQRHIPFTGFRRIKTIA
jgi:hypothetical protein